jgi:ribokinase
MMHAQVSSASRRRAALFVIGSIITDLVVRVKKAPEEGETVIGSDFGRYPGGKGANQAVAAAKLGARVGLLGRVGDDLFGADQLTSIGQAGVDTSYIGKDADLPSGVASIVVDEQGRNRIAIVPGANNEITPALVDNVREQIAAADLLLLQLELPLETNLHAIALAGEVGTPVVLNPAPAPAEPLDPQVLAKVDILTPNEVEAEQLVGMPVKTVDDAVQAARRLLGFGVRRVAVTLGNKGALVMEGEGPNAGLPTHIPPYKVQAVDTVAAGDAFNGALAVRLALGDTLVEAAKYANAVAAVSVTRHGAQPAMPTQEEVERFIRAQQAG